MYRVKIHLAWYDAEPTDDGFLVRLRSSDRGILGIIISSAAMLRRLAEGTAVIEGAA